jgi:ABC-type Mn2+/Zn2+ transport system ATPase subunit
MAVEARGSAATGDADGRGVALRVEGLSVRLGERLALHDVSFEVEEGSFVGLIGANGSGKSTLLRSVLGIVPASGGSVEVFRKAPADARDDFAFLPQRQQIELDLPLRAWDVAMMGRLRHSGWLRAPGRRDKEIVGWALERVGMSGRRNSVIGEMSFGQQQRVFFARRLLLLDEPMNGVDAQTQDLFLELLREFQAEGRTIVMATHDLNQAALVCDHACVLNQRLVAYGRIEETLTESVLREAYGVHLHFAHGGNEEHVLEDVHHHETEEGRRR